MSGDIGAAINGYAQISLRYYWLKVEKMVLLAS